MSAKRILYFGATLYLLNLIFGIPSDAAGQSKFDKQPPSLGVQVSFHDFRHIDGQNTFRGFNNLKTGITVNYLQGLTEKAAISATVAGSIIDFTSGKGINYGQGDKNLLLETDVSVRRKILPQRFLFPFIQIGAGASVYKRYWGAFLPAGLGAQLNISKRTFLLVNAQYRLPLSITQDAHFYYALGISGVIGKSRSSKRINNKPDHPVKPMPVDTDGDGIVDSLDKCVAVPGVTAYNGCPVPDTDGDGITDDKDSCVNTPGILKYSGCPIPDSDGDRVNDDVDRCPEIPGIAANKGCPLITDTVSERLNTAAKRIFFETGSYQLKSSSYEVLDGVVQLLQKNEQIKIDIEGHTDNQGNETANQLLSERRAEAVRSYLVLKGIAPSRLRAFGYGQSRPVADNSDKEGRAANRRVEMKIKGHP